MSQPIQERLASLPAAGPETRLRFRRGSIPDYAALAEHHYKSHRPATATRVLVLEHDQPTVCGRCLHRPAQRQIAAVLVESLPSLSCRMRDFALRGRYRRLPTAMARARLLNREVRCISRVIVHPQWRGLGLAVRLVREALATPTTIFTEALAAMGHVNPFFARSGMTAYPRPPHEFDARLIAALQAVGLSPLDLALLHRAAEQIESLPAPRRQWLIQELRRWQGNRGKGHPRNASRGTPGIGNELENLLRAAQQRLLCEPVYYLKDNRAACSG